MAVNSGMWVFYFLQGEDGDSVENPNAFNIMGAVSEVRLGQFLQAFPLRGHGGHYHFRFRAPDKVSGYCWMDVSDPSAVLPRYGNVICAKALRLDRLPKPRSSRLRRKVPYALGAATTSGGDERVHGATRSGEANRRRSAQDYPGNNRHHAGQPQQQQQQQQWSNQGRPRSVSPAHGRQMHHDDVNKGKSVTPPPSHGGGGSKGAAPASRGPPPQSAPPPPPENLEEFLFSDSPTGSPRASPRATQGGGVAGSSTPRGGGGSSSGSNNSKDARAGGEGRSGEDLLNFGNDSGGGRPKQQAPEPPPRPNTNGGRSPVPAGWGNRPTAARGSPVAGGAGSSSNGGGASPPGRKSTAGRMQGAAAGRTNGGGGSRGGPSGAPANNGRSHSGGKSVSGPGGGAGVTAAAASNLHRPKSFSGAAAAAGSRPAPPPRPGAGVGGPELMNFNSPRAGGGAAAGGGAQSAFVKTKVQEREEELKANVERALKFKQGIDEAASKDQDAMDAAKVKHDAKLTSWAEDHGKKRNVRTLLSTMHLVLWEGNRWKTVSMGDIIQPSKVKLSYRKAMLLVHPDKCGSLGPEERLIAKRVFEAVNEAYTLFQEKEMS